MASYYYTVPTLGTGTRDDPYRPDIDAGSSFVGNMGSDGQYMILTTSVQAAKAGRVQQPPIQALQNAASAKGIPFTDIQKWSLG